MSSDIYIFEPNNNTGLDFQNETIVKNSSGDVTDVLGLSEDTSTESVTFGQYGVTWQLYQGGSQSNSSQLYTDNFTADAPNGQPQGTSYTDASASSPKCADTADFSMTMYSNGIAITLLNGDSLAGATSVEFDLYANASSSSPLAVLTLDSQALSTLSAQSSKTILVVAGVDRALLHDRRPQSNCELSNAVCIYELLPARRQRHELHRHRRYHADYGSGTAPMVAAYTGHLAAVDAVSAAPACRPPRGRRAELPEAGLPWGRGFSLLR